MSTKENVVECLEELGKLSVLAGENKFKSMAYNKAVGNLKQLDIDPARTNVMEIDGIGESIAKKIQEIVDTGTCEKLEKLKVQFAHLLKLMKIPGIGPATAKKFYEKYGVVDVNGVKKLIDQGEKINENIKLGVDKILTNPEERISFAKAEEIVSGISAKLSGGKFQVCGSFRRKKETIGDLDFAIQVGVNKSEISSCCETLLDKIIIKGEHKISGYKDNVQVDFRFCEPEEYGSMILYFTGSRNFNINMRKKAISLGYKLNEYGLWNGAEKIAGEDEEGIFNKLDMEYVEPENRK